MEAAQDGKGPILVSIAQVHWPEKGLLLTVFTEQQLWTASESATTVALQSFMKSAQALQRSLGPADTASARTEQGL